MELLCCTAQFIRRRDQYIVHGSIRRWTKKVIIMLSKAVLVLWLAVASQLVSEGEGVSCGDAVTALIPCGTFLIGTSGPSPTAECCKSAQSLDKMATTTASRRDMCQCLKDTGPSFGVKPERAKLVPSSCKLKINIPISPNVDCTRVV